MVDQIREGQQCHTAQSLQHEKVYVSICETTQNQVVTGTSVKQHETSRAKVILIFLLGIQDGALHNCVLNFPPLLLLSCLLTLPFSYSVQKANRLEMFGILHR